MERHISNGARVSSPDKNDNPRVCSALGIGMPGMGVNRR